MNGRSLGCISFLIIAAILSGCAIGPDYVRPETASVPAFKEANSTDVQWIEAPVIVAPSEKWWQIFDDPVLDQYQSQLLVDNQNLKAVEAQYRAASATLANARSALFPFVDVTGSRTRGTSTRGGSTANNAEVSLNASWELDLWGGIRRSTESAGARLASSEADLAAARLSAQALLAQTYFQLRAVDFQRDVLEKTVEAYARFAEVTKNRLEYGVASALDAAQAETQLQNAKTQLLETQLQRAQLEHAIATLLGKAPAEFGLPLNASLAAVPSVPALVPSELLASRPDIRSSERLVAAANAQIGVAKSAWFPSLGLTGSIGFRNENGSGLLSTANRVWSLGPALAFTLFDGGARAAGVDLAGAGYDEAVANYRQTVLTAFQEVEDNLAAARLLQQQDKTQGAALAAAQRAREIAENQYKAGTVDSLQVISAQATELSARVNHVNVWNRRMAAAIQLLKNTGGIYPKAMTF